MYLIDDYCKTKKKTIRTTNKIIILSRRVPNYNNNYKIRDNQYS